MNRILYGKDIFDTAFSYSKNILLEKRATLESVSVRHDETTMDSETRETVKKTIPDGALLEIRTELEERFPFILASVCAELGEMDAEYRRGAGEEEQGKYSEFFIGLDDLFPLCEKFSFPCAMYTASMFLIDHDSDASDRFFEKYSDAVSDISSKIPFENKRIIEKYPY